MDADWDMEYDKANEIYNEALCLAHKKGITIPDHLKLDYAAPRISKAKTALEWVKNSNLK